MNVTKRMKYTAGSLKRKPFSLSMMTVFRGVGKDWLICFISSIIIANRLASELIISLRSLILEVNSFFSS